MYKPNSLYRPPRGLQKYIVVDIDGEEHRFVSLKVTSAVRITTLVRRNMWLPSAVWVENGNAVVCNKCGKIIRLGDVCASERLRVERRTIVLCLDCLNDRYIDSDDPNDDEYETPLEFKILEKLLEGKYRILSYNKNWELVQEHPPLDMRLIEVDTICPITVEVID